MLVTDSQRCLTVLIFMVPQGWEDKKSQVPQREKERHNKPTSSQQLRTAHYYLCTHTASFHFIQELHL